MQNLSRRHLSEFYEKKKAHVFARLQSREIGQKDHQAWQVAWAPRLASAAKATSWAFVKPFPDITSCHLSHSSCHRRFEAALDADFSPMVPMRSSCLALPGARIKCPQLCLLFLGVRTASPAILPRFETRSHGFLLSLTALNLSLSFAQRFFYMPD